MACNIFHMRLVQSRPKIFRDLRRVSLFTDFEIGRQTLQTRRLPRRNFLRVEGHPFEQLF